MLGAESLPSGDAGPTLSPGCSRSPSFAEDQAPISPGTVVAAPAKRCLGAAFAIYEMKVVLGTLLHENRLRLVSEAPIQYVRRGITMGPKGGVPMVLEARIVKLRKPLPP